MPEERSAACHEKIDGPELMVLGVMQDGGAPHIGCDRLCCRNLFLRPAMDRSVVCLGITDLNEAGEKVGALVEATPDFPKQLNGYQSRTGVPLDRTAIFLTHAHIGHYSGLMYLGREALGAKNAAVHCMPRFGEFLKSNGPWSQLVELQNIDLHVMQEGEPVRIGASVSLTPFRVPHRDEFSETVGYRIEGPERVVLFIPDINKWDLWNRNLEDELRRVDRAYLDATFFDAAEVGYRDMAEIPHPFVVETMERLSKLPAVERDKVHFIHFNHTNPCLDSLSPATQAVEAAGFHIAKWGERIAL